MVKEWIHSNKIEFEDNNFDLSTLHQSNQNEQMSDVQLMMRTQLLIQLLLILFMLWQTIPSSINVQKKVE